MAWDQLSNLTPAQLMQLKSGFSPQSAGSSEAGQSNTAGPSQITVGGVNYVPNGQGGYWAFQDNPNLDNGSSIAGYNGQQYVNYDPTGANIGTGKLSGIANDSFMSKYGPFAMLAAGMAPAVLGAGAAAGAGGAAGEAAGASGGGLGTTFGVVDPAVADVGATSLGGGAVGAGGYGAGADYSLAGAGGAGGAGAGAGGGAAAGAGGSTASNILAKIAANPLSLAGPAASLVSGVMGANAAKDAANVQANAVKDATAQQNAALDKIIALNEPFRQGGLQGMNALLTAYGLQPGDNSGWAMKDYTPSDLTTDPSYQWRLDQGSQALQRSAAAKGGLQSGGFMKDLTNYAQGAASQEYGNAFNRYMQNRTSKVNELQSLAGVGQSATGADTGATQNNANNVSNLTTQGGNATASGIVGGANAWSNALSQGLSQYSSNELLNRLLPQR